MNTIQPIGPGAPRIEPPSKGKRVRRPPKRSRDEPGTDAVRREQNAGEENDEGGEEEQPRVDLRA